MSKVTQLANLYIKRSLVPSTEFGPVVQVVDHAKLGLALTAFRKKKEVQALEVARKMKRSKGAIYFLERGINKWDLKKVEDYLIFTTRIHSAREKALTQNANS